MVDNMDKWYEFHWLDGQVLYLKGMSEADAATKWGIGIGSLRAMDYVKVVKELPLNLKETSYISLNGKEETLNNSTLFVEKAKNQIREGKTNLEIVIGTHMWKCKADVKPFEVILTEYN